MFLVMYLPSYLKYVMNYSIEKTGFLAALPTTLNIPLKFLFGYSSDKFKCLPERQKMLLFNSIAVTLPGFVYGTVGFVPNEHKTLIVLMFMMIYGFFAAAGGGFYKCGVLHSR
jgi:sugar phosphate permease